MKKKGMKAGLKLVVVVKRTTYEEALALWRKGIYVADCQPKELK